MRNRQILFLALAACTKPRVAPTTEASPPPPIEASAPAPAPTGSATGSATPHASAKTPPPTKQGERCGTVTCPPDQYCCNPVMNICANPGEMCAQ